MDASITSSDIATSQRRSQHGVGAATRWEEVEAFCSEASVMRHSQQRFRPPRPERRPCRRFATAEGCPFGDRCTHLHVESLSGFKGGDGVEMLGDASPRQDAPWASLFKMDDRKVGRGTTSLLLRTLETGGFSEAQAPPEQADLVLANAFPSGPLLKKLRGGCTVNHFPGEHEIGAKDRLALLLRGLPLHPVTFLLPEESAKLAQAVSLAASDERDNLWIAKPRQLGEGRGISVLRGGDCLQAVGLLPERPERRAGSLAGRPAEANSARKPNSCRRVVSEYIVDPLLIDGRKVDLRVYVLVTALEPHLEAAIFREGLVRFCGGTYDVSDDGLRNIGDHVSNNAVQTKTARHACASNWTLAELWAWLDTRNRHDHRGEVGEQEEAAGCRHMPVCADTVWRRVQRAVRSVLEAWRPLALLARARLAARDEGCGAALDRIRCFSLLAFDVLVDSHGAVWILEVNPKPALHAQSANMKAVFPKHYAVKASLLADLFSIVGLPVRRGGLAEQPSRGSGGGCSSSWLGFQPLLPSAKNPNVVFTVALLWPMIEDLLNGNEDVKSGAGQRSQTVSELAQIARTCPLWAEARQRKGKHAATNRLARARGGNMRE
eukprot:TRINITY_DN33466_c0_g1_i1.p1 TRINITY_DN33466_c0_g1~~TRINITY_DN33466_c0_g1_i1.p1  ORF type:complete len:606 (-),score=89.37 TRINITY_DN33466_c0_g1_i1:15-1832(-)